MTTIWSQVLPGSPLIDQALPSAADGAPYSVQAGDHVLGFVDTLGAVVRVVIPQGAANISCHSAVLPRYAEGSQACRNYSTLTKDLRVTAFQLLAGFIVGLAIAFTSKEITSPTLGIVVATASGVLFVFAVSLFLVNTHYATAFLFIRDSLARVEIGKGPWTAHKQARRGIRDECSYVAPFLALVVIAVFGVLGGGILLENSLVCSLAVLLLAVSVVGLRWWFRWMQRLAGQSDAGSW